MKYSNTVEYNISTKLDASGLTKMQAEIQKIELMLQKNANRGLLSSGEVEKARTQLENLGTALTKAFDPSLGTLNLEKLQTSLKGTEFTAEGLSKAFKLAGTEGELAFNNLVGQLGRLDTGLTQSNSALDKMFTTFSNTFRWGLVSSFFSQFMNAIHSSVDYVKELDDSLTQIMLVTDYNRDSMNEFARSANEAAKAVSMTTTGMTNASLVFAQQGYDLGQSQELATLSAKLANASQQDTATTSDQITAYMNAYGLENSIDELTQAMDNWALIANISAADVSELAQASQRAASMANTVGVSGEQLAAQIATIESVTREAPEQIGNGLKTLYARFSDISQGGEDEEGVSLGDVTKQLNDIGVRVLDQFGNIRDVGDIMEDLMVIWDDLDQTSKIAAAQSLAGKYQVNRFVSLMDNSDMYREYLGATGSSAAGTLDQMNQEYAESLAGRTQKLQATLEGIFNNLFSTDDFYAFIDVAQKALEAVDNLTEAMGGGIPILTALSGLFLQLFSKNISQEMIREYQNNQLNEIRQQNAQNVQATISQLGLQNAPSEASQNIVSYVQQGAANYDSMSESQIKTYNSLLEDQVQAANQAALANKELANKILEVGAAAGIGLGEKDSIFTGDRGEINTSNLLDVLNSAEKEDFSAINPDDFKEASQEAENLAKSITIAMDTLAAFSTSTDANSEELIDLSQKLDLVKDHLIQLHDVGAISDETFNRMSQTVDSAKTSIIEWDGDLDKITDDLLDLGIEATDLASILQGLSSGQIKWDNLDSSIQSAILQLKAAKDLVQNTNNLGLGFLKGIDAQKQIQGLLDVIGAVTRLASAYMTFQNLGSIWKNEDISKGEKVLQTIMAIGTIVPTVIDSFNKLKNSIPKLIALQNSLTVASTATATAEAGVGVSARLAAGGMGVAAAAAGALGTALKFLTGPWGILLTALGAIASFAWNQYAEDIEAANEKASKVFDELIDQTTETTNKLNETTPALNELYDAYKETGKASDEFKQSLTDQAELLGINDAALLISQGKYDELKIKIDEATEAIYNNNAALQQIKLNKINPNEMVNELTDDQKERYNVTYHQEEGITGISGGTATKGQVNKLDQTPYELVKAAQQDIETQQEKINSLTQERNNLVKEGLTATGEASQKIASDITRVDEELAIAAQKLAESKEFTENHSDVLEATNTIRDNALNQELNNSDSIFNKDYNKIEQWMSALELNGIDSSNIDMLIQKYAELADNAEAAAYAELNMIQNQVEQNPYVYTGIRSGEQGLNAIGNLDLSNEDKLKVAQLFDWNDPEIDAQVTDLCNKINEGLKNGLALNQILAEQIEINPEEYFSNAESKDSNIDAKELQEVSKYLHENNDLLEQYADDLEEVPEVTLEAADAQLRYNKAVERAEKSLDKWKEDLQDLADGEENIEDLTETTNELRDTYEELLNIDPGALSESFLVDPTNLENLEAAIKGDEEAYWDLWEAAQTDILIQAGMDSDQAYAAAADLRSVLYDYGWDDIEIGASLSGEDEILDACERIINAAGMTSEQAQQYLANMGISAKVTEQTEETEDKTEAVGWKAEQTDPTPITSEVITKPGSAGEMPGTETVTSYIGGYRMTPIPITDTATGSATAITMEVETAGGKSGGGGLHIDRSTARKTGGTGAQKSMGRSGTPSSSGGGGGGKGKSCFVAGTLVSTWGGFKPIEQIKKGNIVLSYNQQLGLNEYSEVLQTMIHDTIEPIYTLYIKDEQLRVTGIHRFLVTDKITYGIPQWVHAADLHVGQWVLFADGTWHVIHKIEVNIEHQIVYNFEVSGNHNYYVGYNQILAHNKGGGGGGSKAKTIEPKEKKTHQKDYYEEVSGQLDKTEKILSKIEKEEDRLIGDKARANQNKQLKLLQKEIDLNKEKQKIQQQELKDIDAEIKEQDRLAESIARTGGVYDSIPDAVFDEDGIVSNYEQISAAIDNIHNKLIDQYNAAAAAGNEDLTKKLSKTIEKFDKYGENILKSAQRHDKLQSEIEGTINELEQLQDAIEDLRIEAWKASTEAIDNIKELRENAADLEGLFSKYESDSPFRDLIVEGEKLNNIWTIGRKEAKKYYNDIIAAKQKALKLTTDKNERAAIQMSINYFKSLRDNLSDDQLSNGLLNLAYQDMLQLKEWFENPNAKDNIFGKNTAALKEAYEAAYNKVHDMALEFEKTVKDFRDAIIDGYDEIDEKQNRQIDKFDRIVDKLETFSDMYTLYYGDESYAALRDILQQQGDTLREQLNAQKEIYSYWSEAYAQAIKTGDEKLIQELEDKMHDAEDRMTELAKDAAKAFAESYENAVKASTQYIIQNTIGDRSFDRLDRNWEWDKDYLDKYRDDVEKAYEMDKLRSKYTDLLNQAQGASLQTQNKIRAQMQEQLDLLDGQATVSEYDVKLANAKLEILQKQIALEDAQRNKNQMKLRRDTQGNYRYVYTANQEDVAGAKQDLLDSEYDAYELSKNQQISNYDNLINAYQKYLSQREEILNNANLSEAEKLQQNAELYDKFLKFVNAAKEDFSDAAFGTLDILNWLTLNGTDYTTTAAKNMLNDLLDEQGNIKDQTGIIWMDNANYLTDEVIPKIKNAVNEADQDIKNRMEELKENIVGDDGVFPSIREGGKNLEEGLSGLTGFLDSAKTSTDGLAVATRDLMKALGGDNSALAEAQAQLQKYEKELSNVKNASSITAQQLRDAQKALDKAQTENLNYKTLLDDIASGKRDTKGNLVKKKNTKKTGAAPSKSSKKNGELTGFTGVYHYTSWGDNPVGDWYAGIPNAVRISTFSREPGDGPYNVHLETKEGGHLGWVKEEQLFDTGGYTGNWANGDKRENGKLAFLHQKELVLNAEDTQNILAAVDIVRKIGIGLRNSMMNVSSMNGKNLSSVGETIEQRVEITASFPNATDADDIRQALIGLADKAYQYSHRNR